MTEAQTDIEAGPTDTVDGVSTAKDTAAEESEVKDGGNGEAARYRRRLRDTETERDALANRVERLQRAEIERHAADRLSVVGDLFAVGGVQIADLLTEDGDVDRGLVDTAVFGLLEQRPGLAKPKQQQKGPIITGHRAGAGSGTEWSDVLQNPGKHS